MRYLVTGATGFIGGEVARQLLAQGHQVVTVARTPAKATDLAALGVEVHKGDITDKESLRAPMTDVDGVFHIAAWYEVGTKDKTMARRINVDGTRNVMEMMRELNIPRGVYTSTLAVNSDTHGVKVDESYHYDGPHLTEYDQTKADAHNQVALPMMRDGLPLIIVQPGLVYGIGDHSLVRDTLLDYLRRRLPVVPAGTAYSWAHVEDVAQAHLLAMEKGRVGESYYICGPTHSMIDALALAESITGVPAPRLVAPPAMMKLMASMVGAVENLVPVPPLFRAETLRSTGGVTYIGDNSKAKRELGYQPRPLAEGLREILTHEMRALGMK